MQQNPLDWLGILKRLGVVERRQTGSIPSELFGQCGPAPCLGQGCRPPTREQKLYRSSLGPRIPQRGRHTMGEENKQTEKPI